MDFLTSFLPRAVQDLLTTLAGILVAHGYVTADQSQSFIGATFFLVMLVINYFIAKYRKNKAAVAGGLAVAAQTSDVPTNRMVVQSIVKTAKVVK